MRDGTFEDSFFRIDETTTRLPIGNQSQTRYSHRTRRQAARGKAGAERSVSLWQWQAIQTMLPALGLL